MKTIKFVGYLFYRYYSKGDWHDIPYFTAVCSMTLLGYIHLMQAAVLFNFDPVPTDLSNNIWIKRLIVCLVMLPIFFVVSQLFKRKDLEHLKTKYDGDPKKVSKGNHWLIAYIIISFALFVGLLYLKRPFDK